MRSRTILPPWAERNAPLVLLGIAAAASIVLLLVLQSGFTFFQDEWNFVIHRRGFNGDAFFTPNDIHISVLPAIIYKGSLAIFGMSSVGPVRVVATLIYTATAILVFFNVRSSVGEWPALFAAAILFFLGRAWNDLLWPFEMSLIASATAGLGMLLALDRNDRRGDVIACVLLVLAVSSSTLGIPFTLAAAVDVFLRRRGRGLARAWVPLIPLALYALWYATYGHKVPNAITLHNMAETPKFVGDSIASGLESVTGLSTVSVGAENVVRADWGRPMLVALIALLAIFVPRRARPLSPRVWLVVTAAAAFWILGGFNFVPGREPTESRYQYIDAIFIFLILAELLRGVRPRPAMVWVLGGLTVIAIGANLLPLEQGRSFMSDQSDYARGELAALEIARGRVPEDFTLSPDISGTPTLAPIDAGSYFSAVDAFGSPAAGESELTSLSTDARQRIDVVFAYALPVTLDRGGSVRRATGPAPVVESGGGASRGSCARLPAGSASPGAILRLPPGGAIVRAAAGPEVTLHLRRYAPDFALGTNSVAGGTTAVLDVPTDRARRPWQLQIDASQAVTVCGNAGR